MTKDKALKMAIEVFDMYGNKMNSAFADEAYHACKEALAEQPTQEPVKTNPYGYVWFDMNMEKRFTNIYPPITGEKALGEATPLYTHPKEWQGLSDKELFNLSQQCDLNHILGLIDYARAIEAKLREKNNGT